MARRACGGVGGPAGSFAFVDEVVESDTVPSGPPLYGENLFLDRSTGVIYVPSPDRGSWVAVQGSVSFTHVQDTPSDVWGPINHNLGYLPIVGVVVSGGVVDAEVQHLNLTSSLLVFNVAVAGEARFI